MRRKLTAGLAILFLILVLLAGCGRLVEPTPESVTVYTTFYPIYALADAVLMDIPNTSLHCLVQPQDGCLRSYALSDWDARLLQSADAVISGGRGLESFEKTLFAWGEDGPVVSAVLYNLELYGGDSTFVDSEQESHLKGDNPHLYMSIDGAGQIVQSISAMMLSMDPKYAGLYVENADAAVKRLEETAVLSRGIMSPYHGRPVILMNEALIYTARDYGLEPVEWIDRESGEGLYDESLNRCIERMHSSGARVVLIEGQAPAALTRALEKAGFIVARLYVFSTGREGDGFDAFIQAQLDNARAIQAAFDRSDGKEVSS